MDCLFCKIVKKEIPSDRVYEDERCVAFRDINPQAPVHILVIPREHIPTIDDCQDKNLLGHLFLVATRIAREEGLSERGYRIVANCRSDAGQEVYHLHIHILGGRIFKWPPG